jgi:hypothetical protein
MNIKLHEYSGICSPNPGKDLKITSESEFAVYANRKKSEKVKIILKCERNSADTTFAFKLAFRDKHLKRYSKAIALEIYES